MRGLLLVAPLLVAVASTQTPVELVVSVGHAAAPNHATFAGNYLVTASASNVALIDLASGITTDHLPQDGRVMSLEASPNGELLAVGTCDHAVQLWDLKSLSAVRRIALVQECADFVSFSPDGMYLATGADCCRGAGGLQIWEVRSGALKKELAAGMGVRRAVFSRDGRLVIGVDAINRVHLFEWPTARFLRLIEGLELVGDSESLALTSPNGRYFGWLGRREIRVWDIRTGTRVSLPAVQASGAEFLHDGRLAIADDFRLSLIALEDGSTQEVRVGPIPWAGHVYFEPSWLSIRRDGAMVVGVHDGRTTLFDVAAKTLRDLTAPALTDPLALEWSRLGLIAWPDFASGIRGWNDRSGEPFDIGDDWAFRDSLAFHPAGQWLATAGDSSLHIINVPRKRTINSIELPLALRSGVAFSPNGARLAFTSSDGLAIFDGRLRVQTALEKLDQYASAEYIAFSPNGRWVAAGIGGPQPAVKVWPSVGSRQGVTLDTDRLTYGPQPVSFSSDSRLVASFSKGTMLTLWTTESWKVERAWKLAGTGRSLAFAPQGQRLAIAGDGEAAIWDASTGRKLVALTSHGSRQATQVAWSPDGNRIVTSSDDGVLRFWNAANGNLLASLYTLASSHDWLLVAADGRIDGSERALATLVAWRTGDRIAFNKELTDRRRVRRLWRSLPK